MVPTWKAGPQEGLSRQEAVSTPHAQAQGAHTEVLRLLRLHREVGKSISASSASRLPAQVHVFQMVACPPTPTPHPTHAGGWPPMTSWLQATPVSSATSAFKCCTTMPKATRWEISWPTLTLTLVRLTDELCHSFSALQYSLCKDIVLRNVFVTQKFK